MTNEPIGRRVHGHYVNRVEKLEQEAARRLAFEEALAATNSLEATPAPSICDFEPLWRVCTATPAQCERYGCQRRWARLWAVLHARNAVQSARRGT